MIITNLKPTIDTQKLEIKEQNHITKENYQALKKKLKEKAKEESQKQWKIRNKMAINTYLSMFSLNISEINVPIK